MHEASQVLYGVRVNDNFHILAAWTWLSSILIINQIYYHITFCVHLVLCVLLQFLPVMVNLDLKVEVTTLSSVLS